MKEIGKLNVAQYEGAWQVEVTIIAGEAHGLLRGGRAGDVDEDEVGCAEEEAGPGRVGGIGAEDAEVCRAGEATAGGVNHPGRYVDGDDESGVADEMARREARRAADLDGRLGGARKIAGEGAESAARGDDVDLAGARPPIALGESAARGGQAVENRNVAGMIAPEVVEGGDGGGKIAGRGKSLGEKEV